MTPADAPGDDQLVFCLAGGDGAGAPGGLSGPRAAAIEELEKRYWPAIWEFAEKNLTRYLRQDPSASPDLDGACRLNLADFTSGVFLWLVNEGAQKYQRYKGEPKNAGRPFRAWLSTVVHHRLVDELRVSGARITSADSPVGDDGPAFVDTQPSAEPAPDQTITVPTAAIEEMEERIRELIRTSEFRTAIQECLLRLRECAPRHFLATFLAYGGLLSGDEIARMITGLSPSSGPILRATVATWQTRGLRSLQTCLAGKGFPFEIRQTADWTTGMRMAVVTSFPGEALFGQQKEASKNDE
jgi:RNA polymerase sigma factor (sigma-70 family)